MPAQMHMKERGGLEYGLDVKPHTRNKFAESGTEEEAWGDHAGGHRGRGPLQWTVAMARHWPSVVTALLAGPEAVWAAGMQRLRKREDGSGSGDDGTLGHTVDSGIEAR